MRAHGACLSWGSKVYTNVVSACCLILNSPGLRLLKLTLHPLLAFCSWSQTETGALCKLELLVWLVQTGCMQGSRPVMNGTASLELVGPHLPVVHCSRTHDWGAVCSSCVVVPAEYRKKAPWFVHPFPANDQRVLCPGF